ncbi:MAG: peptidase [Blastocatellia bacterium]|nr:peptidase [Blastocatellia bacterium]
MTRGHRDTETRRPEETGTIFSSPRPRVSASPRLDSVLLIFIDGLGIGTRGEHNPLDGIESDLFGLFQGEEARLPFEGLAATTDVRLGVEGLPQSATGQTAILTGVNAPALIERHLHGYPSPRLKEALERHSIYKKLISAGRRVAFANAYTPRYFEKRPRFVSATTVAAESAGVRLRGLSDLARGRAVFHDFTNYFLIGQGHMVRSCTPEQAGERLARLAEDYDFTLYEHFITDILGHRQDRPSAREHILLLTRFVRAVLDASDLSRQTIIVTSDHGNIEDLSTRSHTLNPVATLVFGRGRTRIAPRVRALTDITPAIVKAL